MATIKAGTYRFNDTLGSCYEITGKNPVIQEINFTVSVEYEGAPFVLSCSNFHTADSVEGVELYYAVDSIEPTHDIVQPEEQFTVYRDSWIYDLYGIDLKTITIPKDTDVSAEFEPWFTANTKRLSTIAYNGSTIATLFGGQKATLKCKDMVMEDDVVVDVAEQTESEVIEEYDGTITIV